MNATSERAILKIIEAGKTKPLTMTERIMSKGNRSYRFEDESGKLVAQFSLLSIVKKRTAKRKAKK